MMKYLLRTLAFSLLAGIALCAAAQGNTIYVAGQMTPCDPSLNGEVVNITVFGFQSGPTNASATLNENCYYYVEVLVPDTAGTVFVGANCANGSYFTDSTGYSLTPPFSEDVIINLTCDSSACFACMTVAQTAPFTATFSSCSTGGNPPFTYLWDFSDGGAVPGNEVTHVYAGPGTYAACLNITDADGNVCNTCQQVVVGADGTINPSNPVPCQACITVVPDSSFFGTIPWSAQFINCSSGGTAPFIYDWFLPDGSHTATENPTFQFTAAGTYGVCLTTTDATGCISTMCDTVIVDADGTINPITPLPCSAGFWAMQAYTDSSSNPGGGVEPILNEVWVWNLSNGGDGNYQFSWDFGDGTTSTDAFPTHDYDGSGPWLLCLTMYSGGCTDTYCDTVGVDENGIFNGLVIDGHTASQNHRSNGFTLNVLQSAPTGITETPAIANLQVWPNPAQNELNLTFNNGMTGAVPVTVIDPSGRTVIAESHSLPLGSNTLRLNTGSLEPGLYMVRIGNDARSVTHRFMKIR